MDIPWPGIRDQLPAIADMLGVLQQMLQEPEFGLAKVNINAVAFHPVPIEIDLDARIDEWGVAICFPGNG
ncbi:hypothetical protein [Pararhizobium antarcticum]|uniref:hypothetical protein n=1 Tax=Pararhizobium antarcticum TaxID=1798805 RepID=UPI001FDA13B2|nr:hypothetical protein [Pararhizobium antarcticum]